MHVARARWPSSNGKTYESIYLREPFRQDGKVKKRDIATPPHCDPAEIAAIELALKHKGDLRVLASLDGVQLQEGAAVGAVWAAAEISRRLGLDPARATAPPPPPPALDAVQLQEGAAVAAVWTAAEIARRLGLDQALGTDFAGQ